MKRVSVTFYVLWSRSAPAPTQGPTSAGAAGPSPATNVSSNKRLQQTQARVDEVSGSRWFVAHRKGADVIFFFSFKMLSSLVIQQLCLSEGSGSRKLGLPKDGIYEEADSTGEIPSTNIFVPVTLLQNKCGHWCQFRNSSQSVRLGGNVIMEPTLLTYSCLPKG